MNVLDRLMIKDKGEWFNPNYFKKLSSPIPLNYENTGVNSQNTVSQPVQGSNIPDNGAEQDKILQGERVNSPENGQINPDDGKIMTDLGFDWNDFKSRAQTYTPESGGFLETMYRKQNSNPGTLDESRLKRMRDQAALTDALGLLAMFTAAAGEGDLRERKPNELAVYSAAENEKDLRNLYRGLNDTYNKGLYNAKIGDYNINRREYEANKRYLDKLAADKLNHDRRLELEGERKKNALEVGDTKHKHTLEQIQKRGELAAGEKEKDRQLKRDLAKERNAIDKARIANSAKMAEIASRREKRLSSAGLMSAKGKSPKDKSIIFPAIKGVPGAELDEKTSQYYIPLDLNPDEYGIILQTAKDALKAGAIPGADDKIKDDDLIRMYVQEVRPEIIYNKDAGMKFDVFSDIIRNPLNWQSFTDLPPAKNTEELDEFSDYSY